MRPYKQRTKLKNKILSFNGRHLKCSDRKGRIFRISIEDKEVLLQYWSVTPTGYVHRGYKDEKRNDDHVYLHKYILKSQGHVHHIDGDYSNNTRENIQTIRMLRKEIADSLPGEEWRVSRIDWIEISSFGRVRTTQDKLASKIYPFNYLGFDQTRSYSKNWVTGDTYNLIIWSEMMRLFCGIKRPLMKHVKFIDGNFMNCTIENISYKGEKLYIIPPGQAYKKPLEVYNTPEKDDKKEYTPPKERKPNVSKYFSINTAIREDVEINNGTNTGIIEILKPSTPRLEDYVQLKKEHIEMLIEYNRKSQSRIHELEQEIVKINQKNKIYE